MKRAILSILLAAAVLSAPLGFKWATDGFRLGKLASDLGEQDAWKTEVHTPETVELVRSILSEPCRYLDRGAQSFVFATGDGEYVVKLFRYTQRPNPLRQWLRTHLLGWEPRPERDKKIHELFSACKLAYEQAPDLTGIVYLHLNQTQDLFGKAQFIDRLGRGYSLDMDRHRFVIQRRARPIREILSASFSDPARCERLLNSYVSLIKQRTDRGIRNLDTKLAPNFGFCGETALELDFGNYRLDPQMQIPQFRKHEAAVFAAQMRNHLARVAPMYVPYFDKIVDEINP